MKYLYAMVAFLTIFISCKTPEPPAPPAPPEPLVIFQDPLVLQEVEPLPRVAIAAATIVKEEFEPIYAVFRILEVSEVNGVQLFFLVRIGNDRTGIEVGVSDSIAEDAEFEKIIGKYKIIEVMGDFFRCEIEELDYKLSGNNYIRLKIGEQLKVPS